MFDMKRPPTRALIAAVAAASLSLLGACSSGSDPAAGDTPAAVATSGVSNVDAAGFDEAIKAGAVVIDVRTPAEFAAGHLDGAVNIDINSPDFAADVAQLDKGETYAVYCRSGNRSAVATDYMQQQGFGSLYNLQAGIIEWQSAGLPVA
jgi:rhodanese-related sulfurtransferase